MQRNAATQERYRHVSEGQNRVDGRERSVGKERKKQKRRTKEEMKGVGVRETRASKRDEHLSQQSDGGVYNATRVGRDRTVVAWAN